MPPSHPLRLWRRAAVAFRPDSQSAPDVNRDTHYECEKRPEMTVGNRKELDIFPGHRNGRGCSRNKADPEL